MWRNYRPEDREQVLAHHAEQERMVGRKMDLPDLWERPVLRAIVFEEDGVISNYVFLEATAEVCAGGMKALPRWQWDAAEELLLQTLGKYEIRMVRAFVPSALVEQKEVLGKKKDSPIARMLKRMNFLRQDDSFAQFFRWL